VQAFGGQWGWGNDGNDDLDVEFFSFLFVLFLPKMMENNHFPYLHMWVLE
jgi:hypothetical protein